MCIISVLSDQFSCIVVHGAALGYNLILQLPPLMKLDNLFSKLSSFNYAIGKQSLQCVNFDLRTSNYIVRKRIVQGNYSITKNKLWSFC